VARTRDPLEPVATTVHMMLAMIAALFAIAILAAFLGNDAPLGIGGPSVCVDVRNGVVPVPSSERNIVLGSRDRISSSPRIVSLCTDSATAAQRVLDFLVRWPANLVAIGALLLAVRLFRFMRRHGIFTTATASRLRALGWFVLLGELGAVTVAALAHHWLVNSMMVEPLRTSMVFEFWEISFLAVFLGAVLISVARVMRISTAMREDLEGTV
jgi:hypothetical protein